MLRADQGAKLKRDEQVLSLQDIVIDSEMRQLSSAERVQEIMRRFNQHVDRAKPALVESVVRGEVVPRGQFIIGHRNEVPEMKLYNGTPIARTLYPFSPGTYAEVVSKPNINDAFYGAHGSYVLNVPIGQYAKAWSGNTPQIYGPGTHVIHDVNFRFNPRDGFVAKNASHFSHGNFHIVRVPVGQIAKVRVDNVPMLLEGKSEPYVFNSPYFSLTRRSERHAFYSADARLIEHGPIKRVMPRTSEVAITYKGGQLEVIPPGVTIINDPMHHVEEDFVSTSVMNLQFPSGEEKARRVAEDDGRARDEVNYEVFTTKDSLKIGTKLFVAFEIEDPALAFTKLRNMRGILDHIENITTVDMGKAVQRCSSQEFLASAQTKPSALEGSKQEASFSGRVMPSAPPYEHIQDEVRNAIARDLKEFGISITRLNFETPKVLNRQIASEMEKQAITAATANAKQSTLAQEYEIETQKAQREAQVKAISLGQENQAKLQSAEADLQAAKMRADARVIEAKAEQQARQMLADQYKDSPALLQIEMMKYLAQTFQGANVYVTPQEMQGMMQGILGAQAAMPTMGLGQLGLFGGARQPANAASMQQMPAQEDAPKFGS